jgi:hypothetical protein
MSGSALPTKLKIALAAQAVFALGLIFYVSQTLLRHLFSLWATDEICR